MRYPQGGQSNSWASSADVRRRMQRQPTRDTGPELALRRVLHAIGLRYRVDVSPIKSLRRRADIVFGPSRVAVFVDGCFWHGCPVHGRRRTHANSEYWTSKIASNVKRDRDTDNQLESAGWVVIRVWEHESASEAALVVEAAVKRRRARFARSSNSASKSQ
nr:very short patch repair endonuclease [Actinomycetospora chiangmaiensis]